MISLSPHRKLNLLQKTKNQQFSESHPLSTIVEIRFKHNNSSRMKWRSEVIWFPTFPFLPACDLSYVLRDVSTRVYGSTEWEVNPEEEKKSYTPI